MQIITHTIVLHERTVEHQRTGFVWDHGSSSMHRKLASCNVHIVLNIYIKEKNKLCYVGCINIRDIGETMQKYSCWSGRNKNFTSTWWPDSLSAPVIKINKLLQFWNYIISNWHFFQFQIPLDYTAKYNVMYNVLTSVMWLWRIANLHVNLSWAQVFWYVRVQSCYECWLG